MAVIAMTREMATLGRDVAAGLAQRLGLHVVHHELVAQDIAGRPGQRESEVQRFLEGEASLFDPGGSIRSASPDIRRSRSWTSPPEATCSSGAGARRIFFVTFPMSSVFASARRWLTVSTC